MTLTPLQQMFVKHYLVSLNASKACIKAGYSPKYANRQAAALLAKPYIQEAIQVEMEKRYKRLEVDQDYVIQKLKEEAELTGEGSSHAARIRALELLGKHLRMFTDKLSLQGSMEVRHGTDPELEKLLEDPEAQSFFAELYARKASGGVANAGKE